MTPLERLTNVVPGVESVIVWSPEDGGLIVVKDPSGCVPEPGAVMMVRVTIVAPGIVVCGLSIVVITIEGSLVMYGLPAGLAGTTITVVPLGGIVIVLGPTSVTTVSGPAVMVCVIIDGLVS